MSKNAKRQRAKIFGTNPMPTAGSPMREKHMKHIQNWIETQLGIKNRITKGKYNSSGKFIKKPDWTTGYLEYEPNPDAAIHEVAHLFLFPERMPLAECQRDMDAQFGFVNSRYGYMKQKRSYFEVLPMGMEQKIRRMMGLLASRKEIKVNPDAPIRTAVEDGMPIAKRITRNGKTYELIRLSSNLDQGCLNRLKVIQDGGLRFNIKKGWLKTNNIHAKINAKGKK